MALPEASSVALLLAGQARTFVEQQVRQDLYDTVARPTRATLFAHLSMEHEYASWHNFSALTPSSEKHASALIVDAIRQQFTPVAYLRVQSDRDVASTSSLWRGTLQHLQRQSVLYLRWLLLHRALVAEEQRRGSLFKVVLRARPDLLLTCALPHADALAAWMSNYDAVQHGDVVLIARRAAAEVALQAYLYANTTWSCGIKIELCVPGLLASRNLLLGTLLPGTFAVVRPHEFCARAELQQSRNRLPDWLACGRSHLATRRSRCSAAPRSWNLTHHEQFWLARRSVHA